MIRTTSWENMMCPHLLHFYWFNYVFISILSSANKQLNKLKEFWNGFRATHSEMASLDGIVLLLGCYTRRLLSRASYTLQCAYTVWKKNFVCAYTVWNPTIGMLADKEFGKWMGANVINPLSLQHASMLQKCRHDNLEGWQRNRQIFTDLPNLLKFFTAKFFFHMVVTLSLLDVANWLYKKYTYY